MDPIKTTFRKAANRRSPAKCDGFTLIEVMIAAMILMVGLLALMALFAKALGAVQFSQEAQIAKQKSREALESVYTARNDASISYNQIQNEADGGIFKGGFQTMYLPGADGIPGTNQDTAILDRVILPGKDGIVQTAPNASAAAGDDVLVPLSNFQRQILIAPVTDANGTVNPFMRRVTVTIRVNPGGRYQHDYETSGYISGSQ
jgi:type II secretory pathway pseudopilin PulG